MLQKGRKSSLVCFINETGATNKGWFDSLVDIFMRLARRVLNFNEKCQDWLELPLIPLFEVRLWWKASICLHDLIPKVMFFHFNQFCGGPAFIEARNTGIMCSGYFLSLSPRWPCLCNSAVSPRPRAVKHTLNHPRNPRSQRQAVAGRLLQSQFVFRLRLWWLDREK